MHTYVIHQFTHFLYEISLEDSLTVYTYKIQYNLHLQTVYCHKRIINYQKISLVRAN